MHYVGEIPTLHFLLFYFSFISTKLFKQNRIVISAKIVVLLY